MKMDALLNDNDEVWVELRGKHIADVIQTLSTKIRDIFNSSSGSALAKGNNNNGKALSINQMAKARKALPEYREIMSKLSQHMQIAHQCMDAFNQQKLLDLSDLEQTLATGKTEEGRNPKLKELLGQVVEYFRQQPNSYMRWRLLAIVIVSQRGVSKASDLQKLLQEANLSREELLTLHNLEKDVPSFRTIVSATVLLRASLPKCGKCVLVLSVEWVLLRARVNTPQVDMSAYSNRYWTMTRPAHSVSRTIPVLCLYQMPRQY